MEKAANITINRKDIIWNYLAIGISAVSGIITIPILLTKLSGDDLGLWYLYLSIGGITSLFDFGFSVTFARNITYCWSGAKELKKDSVAIESTGEINYCLLKNVLNTCKFIYLIISSVAIIIICLSGIVYFSWITEGSFIRMNMTSWMVYSVSIFLSLFYGYYNAFLKGIGDIGGNSRIVFFSKMIQIICTVLFVEMGFGLIGVCSANLVYGICFRMVSKKRFYNYQGLGQILETIPSESSFAVKKEIFMVVWHNAWRTGITSVASFLSNQSSTLLCGAFMSLTETGHYALANRIVALISSLAAVIYNAYQPSLQATFVNNDCEKRKNIMGGMTSGYIFLFTTGILMLSTIGLPIIRIFKKDISIGIFMILVVAIYEFIISYRNIFFSYYSSSNRMIYMKDYLIASVFGVVLASVVAACFNMGVYGLVLSFSVSQIFNMFKWRKRCYRELGIRWIDAIKYGRKFACTEIFKWEKR